MPQIYQEYQKSYPSAHDISIAVQGNLIHIVCNVSMCSRYGQLSNYFLMSVWYNRVETGNLDHPLSYHVTVLCGYGQDNLEKLAIVQHICARDDRKLSIVSPDSEILTPNVVGLLQSV